MTVDASGTTAVQVWTLIVAGLAVVATVVAALLLRRTGKGTVRAAIQAASASERSAIAAEKSAHAAQEAVAVNRETAVGLALRAEADALANRYQDAADQLGHSSPAVRIAGAYAMAKLADDWKDQRQVCIDVICSYLRAPWPSEIGRPEVEDRSEDMVRASIIELISSHLRYDEATPSWTEARFNFSGATFRGFRFYNLTFKTTPDFSGARFVGRGVFEWCSFMRGANFEASQISGELAFQDISISSDNMATSQGHWPQLSFNNAVILESGALILRPRHITSEAKVIAFHFDVAGCLKIDRAPMTSPFGNFLFEDVRLQSTATVDVDGLLAYYSPGFDDEGWGKPCIHFLGLTVVDGARASVGREDVEIPSEIWRL